MKDISIYGAGGFGREVLTLIQHINQQNLQYRFIGFFDDRIPFGTIINGFPVLGGIDELNSWQKEISLVLAIGSPEVKKSIREKIYNPFVSLITLIHPSVSVGDFQYVKIGKGCVICAGVVLTVNIEIGDCVTLNLNCTVGHDTVIGDYSSFMPAVNISGEVKIGSFVYVGTGVKIINQLIIGENVVIGAGSVVIRSLPAKCTAVGVPAKPIKFY